MLMTGALYLKYKLRPTDALEQCMYLSFVIDFLVSCMIFLEVFLMAADEVYENEVAGFVIAEVIGVGLCTCDIINCISAYKDFLANLPPEKRQQMMQRNVAPARAASRQAQGGNVAGINRSRPTSEILEESKDALIAKGTIPQVQNLMESTGKSRGEVIKALAQTGNNADQAFEILVAGDPEANPAGITSGGAQN